MILGQTYSFPITVANGEVTTSYSLTGTLPSGMVFRIEQRYDLGDAHGRHDKHDIHCDGQQFSRFLPTSFSLKSQHVERIRFDLLAREHDPHERNGHDDQHAKRERRHRYLVGHKPVIVAKRAFLWLYQRQYLGNAHRSTNDSSYLHYLGKQFRGSTSANINITINDAAPVISYSTTEITGTKNVAISPHVGPTTSGGAVTSWEISPDPGSAFHFNTGNGYISGTPSILLTLNPIHDLGQ